MEEDVVVALVTRRTGVGDLRAARGVASSSCIGSGGMSTEGLTGLLGLDRDLDREVLFRERGIPKRSCSFWRAAEGFGVVGLDDDDGSTGAGVAGCVFLALGVAGVTVVLVAVVVEDSGREGMREAGFAPGMGVGFCSGGSCFDRERDRDLVRKL